MTTSSRPRLSSAWRRMWIIGLAHLALLGLAITGLLTVIASSTDDRLFAIAFIVLGVVLAVAVARGVLAVRSGKSGATLSLAFNCAAVLGVIAASFARSRPPVALVLLVIAVVEIAVGWTARKSPPFES